MEGECIDYEIIIVWNSDKYIHMMTIRIKCNCIGNKSSVNNYDKLILIIKVVAFIQLWVKSLAQSFNLDG